MRNRFVEPGRLPMVGASILSADFARLAEECATVLDDRSGGHAGPDGAELLHLDVMDGHFVPNLTMGPDVCRALRRAFPDAMLDVHLMVTDPGQYIEPFAEAGADHLTFHIEPAMGIMRSMGSVDGPPWYDPREVAERIRRAGMTAGLAINPPTPVEDLLDLAPEFDLMLVMSVNPGYSGQRLIESALATARQIRERIGPEGRLQMDGGISPTNASAVREAGCDVLVAASAIFSAADLRRIEPIKHLRNPD